MRKVYPDSKGYIGRMIGSIIAAAIVGILAGFLARALLPGKQHMGLVMTMVLGLVGALVGWLIFTKLLGIGDSDKFDLGGLPGAVIGAMIVLFAYERLVANKGGSEPARTTAAPRRRR